jgi:hypothetical protein
LTILAGFLVRDLLRPIRSYARLKEYGFLFGAGLAAAAYGVVHDRVSYELSADYYVFGKGIESAATGFTAEVALLALQAAWSVGLFVGLAFLLLNRPLPGRSQVPYAALVRLLVWPLGASTPGTARTGSAQTASRTSSSAFSLSHVC